MNGRMNGRTDGRAPPPPTDLWVSAHLERSILTFDRALRRREGQGGFCGRCRRRRGRRA